MKNALVVVVALVFGINSIAQNFTLYSSSEEFIHIGHSVVPTPNEYIEIGAENYLNFPASHDVTTMEAGAPALPLFSESVIVPNQGKVMIAVMHDGYTDYENVLVAPSKGSLKRNVNPADVDYTFGAVYSENEFYPASVASMTEPFILRNTRGVTVQVSPYQYNPVSKTLRVYENLQVSVIIDGSDEGYNELHTDASTNDVFGKIYSDFYLNSEAVLGKYSAVDEEGDMLIIARDDLIDDVQPLIDWKNEKGIRTTAVGTDEAGTSDTEIKDYIEAEYASNPNLKYVLLVGDHAQVPSHTYGWAGAEQLWSDSYYGQMTGDYYPELFVGRFSSGSASDIQTMVERTLEYEKTPAAGNWMTKGIGLASNEGSGYGDDGEADWQHARNIRTKLMAYGYTEVYEFYDGSHGGADASGNPSSAMVSAAVNSGVGFFNYTGHGAEDVCVTGNFSSSNINAATNNGMYPFVISVACNNGTFTSGTCISEVWQRATNAGTPSGAIAAAGSTILMAWAEPMQTQDEMAEIITEAYADNYKVTIGGLFYNSQMSMLEDYSSSGTAVEVMQTWVMFGDPSCVYRNKETQNMTVTHAPEVSEGTTEIPVNCDVDDATIAISQNGELLGVAQVTGGVANVTVPAITELDPLKVVGTKQNYTPYEGEITVKAAVTAIEDNEESVISIYPNPANDYLTIDFGLAEGATMEVRDLRGSVVYSIVVPKGKSTAKVRVEDYAAGLYFVKVKTGETSEIHKVVIR